MEMVDQSRADHYYYWKTIATPPPQRKNLLVYATPMLNCVLCLELSPANLRYPPTPPPQIPTTPTTPLHAPTHPPINPKIVWSDEYLPSKPLSCLGLYSSVRWPNPHQKTPAPSLSLSFSPISLSRSLSSLSRSLVLYRSTPLSRSLSLPSVLQQPIQEAILCFYSGFT